VATRVDGTYPAPLSAPVFVPPMSGSGVASAARAPVKRSGKGTGLGPAVLDDRGRAFSVGVVPPGTSNSCFLRSGNAV